MNKSLKYIIPFFLIALIMSGIIMLPFSVSAADVEVVNPEFNADTNPYLGSDPSPKKTHWDINFVTRNKDLVTNDVYFLFWQLSYEFDEPVAPAIFQTYSYISVGDYDYLSKILFDNGSSWVAPRSTYLTLSRFVYESNLKNDWEQIIGSFISYDPRVYKYLTDVYSDHNSEFDGIVSCNYPYNSADTGRSIIETYIYSEYETYSTMDYSSTWTVNYPTFNSLFYPIPSFFYGTFTSDKVYLSMITNIPQTATGSFISGFNNNLYLKPCHFLEFYIPDGSDLYKNVIGVYDYDNISGQVYLGFFIYKNGVLEPVNNFQLCFRANWDYDLDDAEDSRIVYSTHNYIPNINPSVIGTGLLKSDIQFFAIDRTTFDLRYGFLPDFSRPISIGSSSGGNTGTGGTGGIINPGNPDFTLPDIGDSGDIEDLLNGDSIRNLVNTMSSFLSFIPTWLWALLGWSVSATIIIAIIKFIRG